MDGDRRKRKNFSMVNRGVQQSGDVPHGWRRDGVSKTSELPTREELLRRLRSGEALEVPRDASADDGKAW